MLKPYVDHFLNPKQIISYQIKAEETGLSITQVLRERLRISRGLFRKLRGDYRLRFNGKFVPYNTLVQPGDLLEFNFNFQESTDFEPEPLDLQIIYEDQNLLILNKPAGILVHPTSTERTDTLANGVLYHLRLQGNYNLFRPIHRLDRNTSGLLLVGKNQYAQNYMTDQFDRLDIHREYLAFVHGQVQADQGTIIAPIGRAEGSIIERKVDFEAGQKAITHYRVIQRYASATQVAIRLETGRTHQIRVHMNYLGHPLLGDTLYNGRDGLISRHALHSWKIRCRVPLSHELKEFVARLPRDLHNLEEKLTSIVPS